MSSFKQWLHSLFKPTRRVTRRLTRPSRRFIRPSISFLEDRVIPATSLFASGAYIIDMGQATQSVGNALKPYGLVYDLVTNFKVPVNWAINPAKSTFRLDSGDAIPVDFTATITTGTKSYSGGSFIIDPAFLSPAVIADINTWKARGVVVDTLAAPLSTNIYGRSPVSHARCWIARTAASRCPTSPTQAFPPHRMCSATRPT